MLIPFRWNAMVVVPLLAAALPAAAQNHTPQHANPAPPRVFLLDAQELATLRAADVNDPRRQAVVGAAVAAADHAMIEGPFSVMDKQLVPPSGDKHDYMSRATYFWPDPSKPDGLPYIRHDGQTNPENRKITDHEEFGRMCTAARALALAWYFTGKADYSNRAALLLRTWFLDRATKMNPNLEFAQAIMGVNTGRGTGLIDTRPLVDAIDAAGLLAGSTAWTAADDNGLHDWFTQYLHWMRTSKNGMDEDAAKNNHGNWYDVQVTSMELFLGDRDAAIGTLQRVMKWASIFGTSKPLTAAPFAPPLTSSCPTQPAKRRGTIRKSPASMPAPWRQPSGARPRPITIPITPPWRNRSAQTEMTSKPCCCATNSP